MTTAAPVAASAAGRAPTSGSMPRLLAAGLLAGLWTVVVGFGVVAAPVLLAWLGAGAREPLPDALGVASAGWLLGFGVTLGSPDASWGLAPLGLTLVSLVLGSRAASWALEWSGTPAGSRQSVLVATVAGTAAAAGAVAAARTPEALVAAPGEAATRVGLVLGLAALLGLAQQRWQTWRPGVRTWQGWVRAAVAPAGAALGVLTAASAAALTLGLLAGFSTITALLRQVDPGLAGGLALLAVSVAYLPTALVWVAAVLVGPGVAVGAGTQVSAGAVEAGTLPGFPLLGALPADVPGWFVAVGPVTLALAGVAAGVLLGQRLPAQAGRRDVAAAALLTGALAGLVSGVAAWAAQGPLGPGDLAVTGSVPAQVAGVVGLVVATVAAAVAVPRRWRAPAPPAG